MRGEWAPGGGESGIRTRGGLLTLTRFPGVRLKPLIHLSGAREFSRSPQPPAPPLAFSSAMAVPISAETSLMLPGTIIVLFFCASCA
jgi:hypothetical protein